MSAKYVKFKKDYPVAGYKEGDVIKLRDKIPPHLKAYVTESSKSAYDKHTGKEEGEENLGEIRGLPSEKDQDKAREAQNDPSQNTGNAEAAAKGGQPKSIDGPAFDPLRAREENARLNPDEISQPGNRLPNDATGAGRDEIKPASTAKKGNKR